MMKITIDCTTEEAAKILNALRMIHAPAVAAVTHDLQNASEKSTASVPAVTPPNDASGKQVSVSEMPENVKIQIFAPSHVLVPAVRAYRDMTGDSLHNCKAFCEGTNGPVVMTALNAVKLRDQLVPIGVTVRIFW